MRMVRQLFARRAARRTAQSKTAMKRAILGAMSAAELADIGLRPADVARLEGRMQD